ncbi:mitochondrial carrier domain-containing protein [Syncephalastrum racemosum]|uniref:Mitochondrial carrier domain-containing protein n=1 Tax=Syncephalastrum racemosum TaxID=13706 RepID=A0A1X2H2L6_SYNRA|nr:mitochondrial carrier domain-containing protein [Syncephalastrum racemosum]
MPSYLSDSRLNSYESAFCGAAAGVVSRVATAPLDVVKIRMQLQTHRTEFRFGKHVAGAAAAKYNRIIPAMRTILREEGILGLYKGNLAAEYLYLLYNAVEFCAFREIELALDTLDPNDRVPHSAKTFIGGMLGGSIATATTYPLDLLRTRFAMQGNKKHYTGLVQAMKLIYRNEGIAGFYGGIWPAVIQIMPYMGLVFASYDKIATTFKRGRENGILNPEHKPLHDILSGALSGVVSKIAVYPMDLVRKRLQVQGPNLHGYVIESIPAYATRSWLACLKHIAANEGITGLYRGLTVALIKVAPAISLTFFVYEKAKDGILWMKDA